MVRDIQHIPYYLTYKNDTVCKHECAYDFFTLSGLKRLDRVILNLVSRFQMSGVLGILLSYIYYHLKFHKSLLLNLESPWGLNIIMQIKNSTNMVIRFLAIIM